MSERPQAPEPAKPGIEGAAPPAAAATPPRRSPGHRGTDIRDTVAEMAARAQEISQEAGSRMAAAMKDVINAAAGLTGFSVESARDLVYYMVRRGQMTQEEADKLLREAEDAQPNRKGALPPPPPLATRLATKSSASAAAPAVEAAKPEPVRAAPHVEPIVEVERPVMAAAKEVKSAPAKPAAAPKAPAAKVASKPASKAAPKAAAKAKPAAKAAAKPAKPAAKAAAKPAAKKGAKKR